LSTRRTASAAARLRYTPTSSNPRVPRRDGRRGGGLQLSRVGVHGPRSADTAGEANRPLRSNEQRLDDRVPAAGATGDPHDAGRKRLCAASTSRPSATASSHFPSPLSELASMDLVCIVSGCCANTCDLLELVAGQARICSCHKTTEKKGFKTRHKGQDLFTGSSEAAPTTGAPVVEKRRVLGPLHPSTLTTMGNLALAYSSVRGPWAPRGLQFVFLFQTARKQKSRRQSIHVVGFYPGAWGAFERRRCECRGKGKILHPPAA
jgi:hypothetical protein